MAPPVEPERRVERFVLVLAAGSAIVYGVCVAILARTVPPAELLAPTTLAVAAGLLAAYTAFQFFGFEFQWRGHWLTANLDEAVLFLSLLWLPGPAAVLLPPLVEMTVHAAMGRPRVKTIFNVAQIALAAAAAWDVWIVLRGLGAPTLVAAAVAVPVYVMTSNLLLAGIFARLDGERTLRVYLQRLAPTTLALSVVGLSGGLAVYALAQVHPLAILALAPFGYAMRRNTVLVSRADRELVVYRHLAERSSALVERWDDEAVVDFALATCGSTLPVGRARFLLYAERADASPREWSRDLEGGPAPDAAGASVDIPGREGRPLGSLTVWPRPGQRALSETDLALVRIIAAHAASAVLNVRAVLALDHAHHAAMRQQESLAKQEKLSALGMLIANVAHEIGNPLSYMRLSVELLRLEAEKLAKSPDAATRAAAEKLLKNIAMAQKGVVSVVDISNSLRAVARQGPSGTKPVDVNAVVKDVANVVRVGFLKNVAIEVDLSAGATMVNGNAGELTQVILNLAKNAAEAIGDGGGRVRLATRAQADRVHVIVEDDGPGIPAETLDRLFQPFFTTKEQGTGIGLHISRGIARAHGGELSCVSDPGVGTRFIVDLPALAADPSPKEGSTVVLNPRPADV